MVTPLKDLPLGLNTLQTTIENDMVYVDKTALVYKLTRIPGRYHQSWPG